MAVLSGGLTVPLSLSGCAGSPSGVASSTVGSSPTGSLSPGSTSDSSTSGASPSGSSPAASSPTSPGSPSPGSDSTGTGVASGPASGTSTSPGSSIAGTRQAACPPAPSAPLRTAPGAGKTVALTFDDGPGGVTPQVRAILRRYGVRATFFDVGSRMTGTALAEQAGLRADGHEVGDHTWDHRYPRETPWTVSYLQDQMSRTDAIGGPGICFFRPPGGVMTNVLAAARSRGLTVALWSVDTRDWTQPAATTAAATNAIVRAATRAPGMHPVVLMHVDKASHEPESAVHANRGNTVAALPRIIEWYRAHGYRFVDLRGGSGLSVH